MSYSREEVKAVTDKVLNMAKADGVEVEFSGGERSATRYANSTITANLDRARSGGDDHGLLRTEGGLDDRCTSSTMRR